MEKGRRCGGGGFEQPLLGYRGNTGRHHLQAYLSNGQKILECDLLRLLCLARFHTEQILIASQHDDLSRRPPRRNHIVILITIARDRSYCGGLRSCGRITFNKRGLKIKEKKQRWVRNRNIHWAKSY